MEKVKLEDNKSIADLILTIHGGLNLESHQNSNIYYDCELKIAKGLGIDLNDYEPISYMAGLRQRGGTGGKMVAIRSSMDAYELYLKRKESECDKVLKELHLEWGENWDLVIDFFGQEMADKIDKAVGYEK